MGVLVIELRGFVLEVDCNVGVETKVLIGVKDGEGGV